MGHPIPNGRVMSYDDKDVLIAVKLLQLASRPPCNFDILAKCQVEQAIGRCSSA